MRDLQHPDITRILATGYAVPVEAAEDSMENRLDYIRENLDEFFCWLQAGEEEVIESFIDNFRRDYTIFLES